MPHVSVWVDAEDCLADLTTSDLQEELKSRAEKGKAQKHHSSNFQADYRIPAPVARETLDEVAHILRKANRFDLAFKCDEIREDFIP